MIALKDLECLIALARHRHFARAAAQCGLSQPAFSMRIRNLEDQLGTPIVRRANRFQGLTVEGEAILARARRIVGEVRGLEEEVRAARGEIAGDLTMGTIPTASAFAAHIASWLRQAHPRIRTRIETATSLAVQQGIDDGRFDAGLTYAEGVSEDFLEVRELYAERYVLLAAKSVLSGRSRHITWAEAANLPLILLERDMQNRRIIDQVFLEVGAAPEIVAETNGFMSAVVMALQGTGATVLPRVLVDALGPLPGARMLALKEPQTEKSVALVTPRGDKNIPVVEALKQVVAKQIR